MSAGALATLVTEIPSPSTGVWWLGPVPIRGYALSILLGIVVAVWVAQRRIGTRGGTAGQVLVMHDMLGLNLGKMPKFVCNFMAELPGIPEHHGIKEAMLAYVKAVKSGAFPDNSKHAW